MKFELMRHKLAYATLFVGLSVFLVIFLAVWPNRLAERITVIALVAFYMLWGIVTHVKAEHISRRIITEYVGVSLLAGLFLLLITF